MFIELVIKIRNHKKQSKVFHKEIRMIAILIKILKKCIKLIQKMSAKLSDLDIKIKETTT